MTLLLVSILPYLGIVDGWYCAGPGDVPLRPTCVPGPSHLRVPNPRYGHSAGVGLGTHQLATPAARYLRGRVHDPHLHIVRLYYYYYYYYYSIYIIYYLK